MKIKAPTECPSCGSTLERVNARLFCLNKDNCNAQSSKKVINFCKKLKIKGFGESTVDKLNLVCFNDLIKLDKECMVSKGFSSHMAEKLVKVVKDRLEAGISPNDFLAACSIPLIGDGAMRKLYFESISNLTYDMCKKQSIGDIAATNLITWIETDWPTYEEYWAPWITKQEALPEVGNLPSVCITGKLNDFSNRTEASAYLSSLGFIVKPSVTKQVQYLISEDGKKSSSYTKAISYGLTVTTIKHLEEKYVK